MPSAPPESMDADAAIPAARSLRYGWSGMLVVTLLSASVRAFLP
ncbi:hypothetical protein [Streptomyces sp. M54]|nr:hypothetical protein [Streptomyces sp. M54]